jgi:hypothetical protein
VADPASNPALSSRVQGGTRSSAIRVGLLILTVLVGLIAWIMLAARTKVTVIVQAPVGTTFSLDGDASRPRLRSGAKSTGASELHYLRLTPGAHEISVQEPTGEEHAHVLELIERDRPLMLVVRNRQLVASGEMTPE